MSEPYLYVTCTCFRDGLTSPPPVAREHMTYDRFGNPMHRRSRTPWDDPSDLWDWREELACQHRYMEITEAIWWTVDPHWLTDSNHWLRKYDRNRVPTPSAADLALVSGQFPNALEVIENLVDKCAPEIVATAETSKVALAELRQIESEYSDNNTDDSYQHSNFNSKGEVHPVIVTALEASIATGNPIVYYYNGSSLKYDEFPDTPREIDDAILRDSANEISGLKLEKWKIDPAPPRTGWETLNASGTIDGHRFHLLIDERGDHWSVSVDRKRIAKGDRLTIGIPDGDIDSAWLRLVARIVRAHLAGGRYFSDMYAEIERLGAEGISDEEIAVKLGIYQDNTVARTLRQEGKYRCKD
jgi:hypothetical protein